MSKPEWVCNLESFQVSQIRNKTGGKQFFVEREDPWLKIVVFESKPGKKTDFHGEIQDQLQKKLASYFGEKRSAEEIVVRIAKGEEKIAENLGAPLEFVLLRNSELRSSINQLGAGQERIAASLAEASLMAPSKARESALERKKKIPETLLTTIEITLFTLVLPLLWAYFHHAKGTSELKAGICASAIVGSIALVILILYMATPSFWNGMAEKFLGLFNKEVRKLSTQKTARLPTSSKNEKNEEEETNQTIGTLMEEIGKLGPQGTSMYLLLESVETARPQVAMSAISTLSTTGQLRVSFGQVYRGESYRADFWSE